MANGSDWHTIWPNCSIVCWGRQYRYCSAWVHRASRLYWTHRWAIYLSNPFCYDEMVRFGTFDSTLWHLPKLGSQFPLASDSSLKRTIVILKWYRIERFVWFSNGMVKVNDVGGLFFLLCSASLVHFWSSDYYWNPRERLAETVKVIFFHFLFLWDHKFETVDVMIASGVDCLLQDSCVAYQLFFCCCMIYTTSLPYWSAFSTAYFLQTLFQLFSCSCRNQPIKSGQITSMLELFIMMFRTRLVEGIRYACSRNLVELCLMKENKNPHNRRALHRHN